MRYKTLFSSPLIGAVMLLGSYPNGAIAESCPSLKKASLRDPTFNEEIVSFSYASKTYPVAIFSAFAKQNLPNVSNPNFCFRYEAENKAQDVIEKFYWPLAGFQMDTVMPHQRPSIQITKPPGRDPAIEETWIYAFLNAASRTYAFQRRAESRSSMIQIALKANDNGKNSVLEISPIDESTVRYTQLATIDGVEQQLELKEPTTFPEVSSQFSSGDADEVLSTSQASWSGENSEIQIKMGKSNEKTLLFAPVTYALYKASNISEFLGLIRDFTAKRAPLPFGKDNSFELRTKIWPASYDNSKILYVVEQPITLSTPNGNICFSSPVYSPIPIPAAFLQCSRRRDNQAAIGHATGRTG